jgi:hypothetical protein
MLDCQSRLQPLVDQSRSAALLSDTTSSIFIKISRFWAYIQWHDELIRFILHRLAKKAFLKISVPKKNPVLPG